MSEVQQIRRSSSNEDELAPTAFTGNNDQNNSSSNNDQSFEKNSFEDAEDIPNREENDIISRNESNAAISRSISRRLTNADELIAEANKTDEPLPKMGGDRDYPPPLPDRTPYMVSFDGPHDPLHPHNWPLGKKILTTSIVGFTALVASMGSAMFAEASPVVMQLYHVGYVVATLGTSLFVFGFAFGPIAWGPLSEIYGRKNILSLSGFLYVCFTFAVATAKDLQTIMICRFFAGCAGGGAVVITPAVLADIYGPASRGKAMNIFAAVLFGAPMLSPIAGGFIVKNSSLGWRWTSYMVGIIASASLAATVFLLDESHHGIIMVNKAETLRRRTGNWGIAAPHEEFSLSFKEIFEKNILRPIKMFKEPILFLISLYNAFIYGILYLCLTAVPLIFQGKYFFVAGVAELPYISMFIGILVGAAVSLLLEKRIKLVMAKNNGKVIPEERLVPMMVGAPFFAAGLFWAGWAGDFGPRVHWIVPTIGLSFIGFGLMTIFMPCMTYLIDCYLFYAASAMSANALLRSSFGAAFPLFAKAMMENMKIRWAMTLLGCVGVVAIPVPFLFYFFGKQIRKNSKYSMDF